MGQARLRRSVSNGVLGAAIRSHRPAFNGLRHESCQCIEKCGIVLLVHMIQIPQTAVAYFEA